MNACMKECIFVYMYLCIYTPFLLSRTSRAIRSSALWRPMTGNYAQIDVPAKLAKPGGLVFLRLGLKLFGAVE